LKPRFLPGHTATALLLAAAALSAHTGSPYTQTLTLLASLPLLAAPGLSGSIGAGIAGAVGFHTTIRLLASGDPAMAPLAAAGVVGAALHEGPGGRVGSAGLLALAMAYSGDPAAPVAVAACVVAALLLGETRGLPLTLLGGASGLALAVLGAGGWVGAMAAGLVSALPPGRWPGMEGALRVVTGLVLAALATSPAAACIVLESWAGGVFDTSGYPVLDGFVSTPMGGVPVEGECGASLDCRLEGVEAGRGWLLWAWWSPEGWSPGLAWSVLHGGVVEGWGRAVVLACPCWFVGLAASGVGGVVVSRVWGGRR